MAGKRDADKTGVGKGLPARRQGRSRKTVRKVKSPGGEPGAKPSNQGGARQGGGESSPVILRALELAGKGIPVFPCKEDKRPYTSNGFHAATVDEPRIRKWWTLHPDALIGVPTGSASGINVLDVDLKGVTIKQRLAELTEPVPATRMHTTRSGGRHYLFAATTPVKSRAGVLPGIDTRGEGGYVIWWAAHGGAVVNAPLAPTPAWLAEVAPVAPKPAAAPAVTATIAAMGWPIVKRQIERELATLDPNVSNTEWSEIGMALHHESGGLQEALDMWEAWSAKATRLGAYRIGETAKRWRSFPTDREAKKTWAKAVRDARAAQGPSQEPAEASVPKGLATGGALMRTDFAPPTYALTGAIEMTTGSWLLAGKPKDGKTWLAMNLTCAIVSGREYVGCKPPSGPVPAIYASLDDDSQARFARRLKEMDLTPEEADNLLVVNAVDGERYKSAMEMVEELLKAYPAVRWVVLDTLGSFRDRTRSESVYQQEYDEIKAINSLAHKYGVCVVIVHHFRKGQIDPSNPFESISGTLGLQGGCDGMIVLSRKDYSSPSDSALDEKLGAIWYRGRDIESGDLGARLRDGKWTVIGGAYDVLQSETLRAVLEVMRAQPNRAWTSREVYDECDGSIKHEAVRKAMQRACKSKLLVSLAGKAGFRLAPK